MVAIDARRSDVASLPSGFEVYINGGRTPTGLDAVEWAQRAEALGAGEILLTSMDHDGTRDGFDLPLTRAISDAVTIPVIASGGVGELEHLVDGVVEGHADAVLAASIFHFGEHTVGEAKAYHERAVEWSFARCSPSGEFANEGHERGRDFGRATNQEVVGTGHDVDGGVDPSAGGLACAVGRAEHVVFGHRDVLRSRVVGHDELLGGQDAKRRCDEEPAREPIVDDGGRHVGAERPTGEHERLHGGGGP